MSGWIGRALQAAARVYEAFLERVVENHVLKERCGNPLPERLRREIESGKKIDLRPPRLLTKSGKGGWPSRAREAGALRPVHPHHAARPPALGRARRFAFQRA